MHTRNIVFGARIIVCEPPKRYTPAVPRIPRDSVCIPLSIVTILCVSLLRAVDGNSDVITYEVIALFSVYGYRLLRRYPSYYCRSEITAGIENKRRNIDKPAGSLRATLPAINTTIKAYDRGVVAESRGCSRNIVAGP